MGRLPKKGVDYFPHDTVASSMPTLYIIQQRYGNDGYAFWFKLLEFLGLQDGLKVDFSIQKDWLYFLSIAKVDAETGEDIMSMLADIDAIDKDLWRNSRVVWSQNFADRLAAIYVKRGVTLPKKPSDEKSKTNNDGDASQKPKKGGKKGKSATDSNKVKYAENVSMTESEYKTLVERVGQKGADACIEKLDNYKGSSGKRYSSDYKTIFSAEEQGKIEQHQMTAKVMASYELGVCSITAREDNVMFTVRIDEMMQVLFASAGAYKKMIENSEKTVENKESYPCSQYAYCKA